MADTAAHLIDDVLPLVPVRQWVQPPSQAPARTLEQSGFAW
jgi:hypothetical protein